MKIENLRKRLEALETKALKGAVILPDGTKWIPKVSLLDVFVSLMEAECQRELGETVKPLSPEIQADVEIWARYEPRPGDAPFIGMIATMAKELVK